ncbi:MAG: response regulator [Sphingobacteriaceae bacterium]|jgi:signal transduction histidine kinase/ActR/RegA family two-component response regulator|nr:response regulator [Sphingobacteriaceae bacterium]
MPQKLPFSNWSLKKVLSLEQDPINQARIKMVIYGLWLGLIITSTLIPYYFIYGPSYQLLRSCVMALIFLSLIKVLLARPVWRETAHIILLVITFLILSNIYFKHTVTMITVQYAVLIVMYSFFGLGIRWGFIYSLFNIACVVLFVAFDAGKFVPSEVQEVTGRTAFIVILITNFSLILFGHYHFFKAFQDNIIQLKKAAQIKSDFLSTMSHELRTPLNSVIGMANLLLIDNPTEAQKENLGILKFSAENLLMLINDVLDFNKIESAKIELEHISFNITELVYNICRGKKAKAEGKGIKFHLKVDSALEGKRVYGDPMRLTQVLYNLLGNAIKFTRAGAVSFELKLLKADEQSVQIGFVVADTGIGIEPEKQKIVFEPFAQASRETTREFGGTGLGLSIVKHLVELSGGEITMKSQPGVGTEFSFNIQFDVDETIHPDVLIESPAPVALSGFRILLVEDNAMNILLVKKLFAKWWDLEPEIAENGKIALEMVKEGSYDLVLMDLHMPVMDGYQATTIIRSMADPKKAAIPIIALTASVSRNTFSNIKDIGMDDYVHKPFNPDTLKAKIEKIYKQQTSDIPRG